eukprot:376093-Pleurochrysis_carterae.AAC.2
MRTPPLQKVIPNALYAGNTKRTRATAIEARATVAGARAAATAVDISTTPASGNANFDTRVKDIRRKVAGRGRATTAYLDEHFEQNCKLVRNGRGEEGIRSSTLSLSALNFDEQSSRYSADAKYCHICR